jgi:hypothetical protein
VLSVQAQRTITGRVVDDEQKEAVIQATIALLKTDSTVAANTVTNMEGQFTMTAPVDGRYIVRVSYVGFKTLYKNISVEGKPLAMGTLTIQPDSKLLKEVEVVKNVAKVYSKEDTLIYNAMAYKTPEGSVVEELVKKLPGAEVSDDGTITINGKQVKKIMVDGKEFMTGDTKTAIKNLPTSIVERVKAYDQKSDMTRITGIDDGEEQTVLDFGLKKGMNRGTFANVDAGVGTKSRYSARGMGASFNSDLRVMAFGNANNVNDMGFGGGGGGGRFGGGGRNGLQAAKMVGVNVNYEKKDKLKLDGSVRWNHNDGDAWSRRASENFVSTTGSFSNSVNQNFSRSNAWEGQMRVEWMPDSMTNILFRPTFNYSTNDGTTNSMSATFVNDPYLYATNTLSTRSQIYNLIDYLRTDPAYKLDSLVVNSRDNQSLTYSDSKRFGGELQLNRKLSSNGRNITLRVSANSSKGTSESLSLSDVYLYLKSNALGGDSSYWRNRYNLTPQDNYDYSVRLAYSEPIMKQTYLQFSYNFRYRHTKSERSTYDLSNLSQAVSDAYMAGTPVFRQWGYYFDRLTLANPYVNGVDTWGMVDSLSRYSEYNNYIHTGEIMLRVVRKDYNFNVGLQIIPQTSKFTYRYLGVDYGTTTRNVINWSPTANFRWKLNERGQMRFQYRGTTSQPSMTQLLPISDNSDPLNVTEGNSGLKPSFTQTFNWRFNNYYERHQRFVFANVNFQTTSNSVANAVRYDTNTGGRTTRPENINGNWNVRGEFMMNTALDTLGTFNINTRTTASYAHSVGYLNLDKSADVTKNSANETSLGERLGGSYRNDWFEFELNGAVNYNFARNELQEQGNQDTWSFNYGFNTTLQAPWGMQFTTSLNMASKRGYSDASMNTNELIWNAQISQSFLKGKPLSVRLEFYDILGQQSNFTRAINAMSRTDNEYNAINSYVMLRVNYRLNLFGTKEARQGMRMGPPGGPDGGRGPRGGNRGGGRGGFGGPGFGGPGRF